MSSRQLSVLCLLLQHCWLLASLSCLDASGAPVDYFFGLKAGGCTNASSPQCSFFFSYPPERPSPTSLGSLRFPASLVGSATALGSTLSALGTARLSNSTLAIHWNDDPPPRFLPLPTTAGSHNAHSKGVLAADSSGGVWLTHSWPEFPDVPAFAPVWGIGEASTIYGQSFLCVSLPLPQVERLAGALLRMEPRVYDAFVPPSLRSTLPTLSALAGGARNASYPLPTVTALTAAGSAGLGFLHVAKNGAWGGELYTGAVIPALGTPGLWVETWRRAPQLSTICSANGSAMNVKTLNVTEGGSGSGAAAAPQSYTSDHSKWAVSVCPALMGAGAGAGRLLSAGPSAACPAAFKKWVCVGDINMMSSQSSRGGGTVCFDHAPDLWERLVSAVTLVDTCNASASNSSAALPASSSSSSSGSSGSSGSVSGSPSPSPPSGQLAAQQQSKQQGSTLLSAAEPIGYAVAAAAALGAAAIFLARRRRRSAAAKSTAPAGGGRSAVTGPLTGGPLRPPPPAQWRVRGLLA